MTTLYVNGDSHTAGTYNSPTGERRDAAPDTSFSALLAKKYGLTHINQALMGGSAARVIRTSKKALENMDPADTVVLIGWTSFERVEWQVDGIWHQICGQPWYEVTDELKDRWLAWTTAALDPNSTRYDELAMGIQSDIMEFHIWLTQNGFQHRFFHAFGCFPNNSTAFTRLDWPAGLWIRESANDLQWAFTDTSIAKGHQHDEHFHFGDAAHADYVEVIEPGIREMLIALGHNDLPV